MTKPSYSRREKLLATALRDLINVEITALNTGHGKNLGDALLSGVFSSKEGKRAALNARVALLQMGDPNEWYMSGFGPESPEESIIHSMLAIGKSPFEMTTINKLSEVVAKDLERWGFLKRGRASIFSSKQKKTKPPPST